MPYLILRKQQFVHALNIESSCWSICVLLCELYPYIPKDPTVYVLVLVCDVISVYTRGYWYCVFFLVASLLFPHPFTWLSLSICTYIFFCPPRKSPISLTCFLLFQDCYCGCFLILLLFSLPTSSWKAATTIIILYVDFSSASSAQRRFSPLYTQLTQVYLILRSG